MSMEVPEKVDALLTTILSWPRGDGSPAELKFREWVAEQIRLAVGHAPSVLARGCIYVTVPRTDGKLSTTLFSCHMDTVDMSGGALVEVEGKPGVQTIQRKKLVYDAGFGLISIAPENKVGTCLGADDGIGVWMMLNMIQRKVPGGYIFHTGEESGGQGSNAVLKDNRSVLEQYDIALAFDRPRTDEVITHQGSMECASNKCATALVAQLNKHDFFYKLSPNGTFTDTKVYRKVIAECFNLGVGYQFQHGAKEEQDYGHAVALLEAVCKIDFETLPIDRDPTKADVYKPGFGNYGGYASRAYGGSQRDLELDERPWPAIPAKKAPPAPKAAPPADAPKVRAPQYKPLESVYDDLLCTAYDDLVSYLGDSPESAANDIVYLLAEIAQLRGQLTVFKALLEREGNV